MKNPSDNNTLYSPPISEDGELILILSYLSHDLIIKTADLFGCVRVGVECTDLDPEAKFAVINSASYLIFIYARIKRI